MPRSESIGEGNPWEGRNEHGVVYFLCCHVEVKRREEGYETCEISDSPANPSPRAGEGRGGGNQRKAEAFQIQQLCFNAHEGDNEKRGQVGQGNHEVSLPPKPPEI